MLKLFSSNLFVCAMHQVKKAAGRYKGLKYEEITIQRFLDLEGQKKKKNECIMPPHFSGFGVTLQKIAELACRFRVTS